MAASARQRQNDSCSSTAGAGRQFQNWKMKAARAKKVEFVRTAEKLKTQLANIEKGKNGHLYNRRSNFRVEYSMLKELEHSMTVSRKTERAKILQQLSKIQNNVKTLQQQLKDVKPTPGFVDRLKEMMEEVENAISAFKEEQRQTYEQLLKEEKTAINELSVFERKVWASGSSTTEKVLKLLSPRASVGETLENHLPEEVVEFERFLQRTGGRQGGWDDYDHQNFLKVWTKHKGRLSYMDEALGYLCGRTKKDIEQHDKWYQEFLILQERKKESIRKWKEKQQQEKEGNLKEKKKSEKMLKEEWLQHEEAQKQKVEKERKRQKTATEAWKKQKAIAFAMEQASQLKIEEEKEKKQQKECQRQCHIKLLLERYTLQKKEKEKLEKLEKEKREEAEKKERKRIAAEEITKFQERDLHKLELRILQKQAKEVEKQEKEKRLAKLREKVEIHVTRDQTRLYRPTKGWEEHMKETAPSAAEPQSRIPHRAIPPWRQGL
ncbi:coiled-coil domain-containing protein 112 isoform X1 [Falco peregrinus]|uniref:coiled-coil domain-containing protein 112 isoform X1 n=2 Tax=Falco peregrinus TaxID=8954 RepID=UPI0024783738|nr:coiled-coil domain-containing protein 112 isoform X1 [Falco peregrinus]